jgi:phosphatidylglycerophosphate synthase
MDPGTEISRENLEPDRRPLASRDRAASKAVAHWLAVCGTSPNAISTAGMLAGVAAGAAFAVTSYLPDAPWNRLAFAAAAVLIQLRLLANMFDGMVAIEVGKSSPLGAMYNEVPDRISDSAMFIGAGYALGGLPAFGYVAALLAVFLAYLRAQGRVAGAHQEFCGPMAKPQRAFAMTVLAVFCAAAPAGWRVDLGRPGWGAVAWVLALVIAGEVATVGRRLAKIAKRLREIMPS